MTRSLIIVLAIGALTMPGLAGADDGAGQAASQEKQAGHGFKLPKMKMGDMMKHKNAEDGADNPLASHSDDEETLNLAPPKKKDDKKKKDQAKQDKSSRHAADDSDAKDDDGDGTA